MQRIPGETELLRFACSGHSCNMPFKCLCYLCRFYLMFTKEAEFNQTWILSVSNSEVNSLSTARISTLLWTKGSLINQGAFSLIFVLNTRKYSEVELSRVVILSSWGFISRSDHTDTGVYNIKNPPWTHLMDKQMSTVKQCLTAKRTSPEMARIGAIAQVQ